MEDRGEKQSFPNHEMSLIPVNSCWTPEQLLAQEGVFFLKDVVPLLKFEPIKVKQRARQIQRKNLSPWQVIGVKKIWNHWIVRMGVFGTFYRKTLAPRIQPIPEKVDVNLLLRQKGVFALNEVCRHIPFSSHQILYQVEHNPNAIWECGVWKDPESEQYVVDMEPFSVWINHFWEGRSLMD